MNGSRTGVSRKMVNGLVEAAEGRVAWLETGGPNGGEILSVHCERSHGDLLRESDDSGLWRLKLATASSLDTPPSLGAVSSTESGLSLHSEGTQSSQVSVLSLYTQSSL